MRHKLRIALCITAAAGLLVAQAPQQAADPFVVHEWGTFTSVQGSTGTSLEGLQHEEEPLPSFVYSRTKIRECPLRSYGYKGLEVPAEHVTQKMETPVIYFHTKTPRKARVRVDFVGGLLTQWFPVSNLVGPPENERKDGPLDIASVKRSFLEWDVDLLPQKKDVTPAPPVVGEGEPWELARRVDAAMVRTQPRSGEHRMGPVESEHYLFYRGLGTFTLPVSVESKAEGRSRFSNSGDQPIPACFALTIRGASGSFAALGTVPAHGSVEANWAESKHGPKAGVIEGLKVVVKHALVEQGLFGDEAEAMVATWARQWFGTEGTRFLYLVPRALVDGLLPLEIQPKPDALVRVLVGRLEYMTPEAEQGLIRDLVAATSAEPREMKEALERIYSLDRFLEPHLRRVLTLTTDERATRVANKLLAELAPRK